MAEAHAARLHDPVAHSHALGGFLAGAAVGLAAAIGAAVVIGAVVGAVALEVGSAGLATPLVVGVAATVGEFGLNAVVGGKLMGLAEEEGEKLGASSMGPTSGQVSDASPNVFINGRPAARALDAETCDTGKVAQGSLTVGINGRSAARVGDKCTCGAVITQGSPNVLIGGPTGTFAGIQSEVPAWARWAVVVVSILPALGGLARAIAPALAEVEATGVARALQTGVKALGRAMEERGGGEPTVGAGAAAAPTVAADGAGAAATPESVATSATSSQSGLVYRGDGRSPSTIYNDGFQPKGTSTDLPTYVNTNSPSGFVSTSKSPAVAEGFAQMQGGGNVYVVDSGGLSGVDVNDAYPANPFAHEQEIAMPGGVPAENVVGSYPVSGDGTKGDFIANPNYKGR